MALTIETNVSVGVTGLRFSPTIVLAGRTSSQEAPHICELVNWICLSQAECPDRTCSPKFSSERCIPRIYELSRRSDLITDIVSCKVKLIHATIERYSARSIIPYDQNDFLLSVRLQFCELSYTLAQYRSSVVYIDASHDTNCLLFPFHVSIIALPKT